MAIKLGINGFGRIGRTVLRIAAERPEEREADAPGGAAEGAETESGGRKPGAVRRRRRTSDAAAENGAAELPAMPGNAPGRAEGRPDRAREKDLTQCSLL